MSKRKAHATLVGKTASWRDLVFLQVDLDTTATRTVALFRAPYAGAIKAAHYSQELDADGTKTAKLSNLTQSVDITNDADIDALGANAGLEWTITEANADFAAGDIIAIVYTVSVAGSVAAGQTGVALDIERRDT